MRKIIVMIASIVTGAAALNRAVFDRFEYTGNAARFAVPFDPARQFINPVVAGFWPDPSICRKGAERFRRTNTEVNF